MYVAECIYPDSFPLSHLRRGRALPHLRGQELRLQEARVCGADPLPVQTRPRGLGACECLAPSAARMTSPSIINKPSIFKR